MTSVIDADGQVSHSSEVALNTAATMVRGDCNACCIRTVSPTTSANNEFSSTHVHPFLINKPPIQRAYFDIPGANGELSQPVLECSHLYHYFNTWHRGSSFCYICHPLNGGLVGRQEAPLFVEYLLNTGGF